MEVANITKKDLIERFSISLSKIDKDIKSKKLSYVKIGRAVRFRRIDIENYITPSTSVLQ
jgi:excisionase family DNA binding protein